MGGSIVCNGFHVHRQHFREFKKDAEFIPRRFFMEKLTRQQWYVLDEQLSRTPAESFSGEHPGEHMKLIALLNGLGHQPMTKQQALILARNLLDLGWKEEDDPISE
jgi:hypothetical protein